MKDPELRRLKKTMCFVKSKRDYLLIGVSGFIGYFCMTHSASLPVLALIIPVLWILANNRESSFFVILAYHLTISRGLAPGAAVFLSETHSVAGAVVLWLIMSVGVSIPFLVFWSSNKYKKAACLFFAVLFAYFLPPIALIGVVNPMIMSGCLFPGWEWRGLLAVLFLFSLCAVSKKAALAYIFVIVVLSISGIGDLREPAEPVGFFAINTSFGRLGSGSVDFFGDYERFQMVLRDIKDAGVLEPDGIEYIVLPETIAGRLNSSGIYLWKTEFSRVLRADQKVIFGGEIPTDNGKKYDNAMIMISGGNVETTIQRIPVPYSMYRGPFAEGGANLHLFEDGVLLLPDGRKAAVIICYEAFLTLPYILSFLNDPDLILWSGNQWWCKDTSLPLIQERCVALWSQLFNTPALLVRNR